MPEETCLFSQTRTFALNWYRDDAGVDHFERNGISIGSTLSYFIWQASASILHYSRLYSECERVNGAIELARDSTYLRRFVASRYGDVRLNLPPTLIPQLDEQILLSENLRIPRTAQIARLVQFPVRRKMQRRKLLWLSDWTTETIAKETPNAIILLNRRLDRSAIPKATKKEIERARLSIPNSIREIFTETVIQTVLKRDTINWSPEVVSTLVDYVNRRYEAVRETLIVALAQIGRAHV